MACTEPQFSLPTAATDTDATTTTTTTTTTDTTAPLQTFSATLDVRGRRFYSFTVTSARTVRITLDQLRTGAGAASTAAVLLGLGVPSGTGCALLRTVAAAASEEPHIEEMLTSGVYCTQLEDPGTLAEPVVFSIRIELP